MNVAVRDDTARAAGFGTLREALREMGIHSIELNYAKDRTVPSLTEERRMPLAMAEDYAGYRSYLKENGVTISALLVANNFGAADVSPEVAWCVDAVRAAEAIGAPAIRADTIMRGQGIEERAARIQRYVAAMRQVLSQTEGSPVAVGMENHGPQGNDPEFLAGVLEAIPDPRLGLTLDTGNFYWSGQPLSECYRIYARFAPRVRHTHMKSIAYPPEERERRRETGWKYGEYASPLAEGDIDFARVLKLFRDSGYDGSLTIENEALGRLPAENRRAALASDAAHLKRLLGQE
jgi:sugar phosphate isomerase/epimerase